MCLGVPGKVVHWIEKGGTFAQAEVEFAGVRRTCHMACVPDAELGDYVIVHAGVAITKIDEQRAAQVLADLNALGDDDGWSGEV